MAVAHRADGLTWPGPGWWPLVVGLAILTAGVALRVWAIRELGRFFTYAVLVHEGQRVVDTGPYRRIRHPSYTGLLLGMLGVGLMLGVWPATAVCFLPPVAAFSWRLAAEERVLATELGEPYRAYMAHTKRRCPGSGDPVPPAPWPPGPACRPATPGQAWLSPAPCYHSRSAFGPF